MFRLLSTIFLVSVGIFLYSYFRELNPGTITVRTSPDALFELSPVSLVLFSMALGATLVALIVTIKETSHVFMNWRTNRLVRRKEKVDALHRDGTHAFMSKRTADAVNLFERAPDGSFTSRSSGCSGWGTFTAPRATSRKPSASTSRPTASKNAMWKSCSNWPRTWKAPDDTRTRSKRFRTFSASSRIT